MAHVRQSRPDSGLDFQVKSSRICYIYIMYTKIYYVSYIGYLDDGRDKLEDEVVWLAAVKRIWHIQDSQGPILALAFR